MLKGTRVVCPASTNTHGGCHICGQLELPSPLRVLVYNGYLLQTPTAVRYISPSPSYPTIASELGFFSFTTTLDYH